MPYKIESQSSQCPSGKPFAVCKTTDGKVVPGGCHATHAQALAHQRAMMVNVPDARGSFAEALAHDSALSDTRARLGRTVAFAEQFAMEETNRLNDAVAATEEFAGSYGVAERKQGAKEGWALPDGSFPIKNQQDVKDAIGLVGNYKGKYDAKAHVIKRAKAVGAADLIPDSWK